MNKIKMIKTPLSEQDARMLRAGDSVVISGTIFTARDMAHKRLCEAVNSGKPLPFDLSGAVIYFVGPTPARPGKPIGSAGPTTSSRMDAFSPILIKNGLRAMIGKGYRSLEVIEALKKYGAVHLAALGGAGALLSKYIKSSEIVAYEDLGTEAVRRLEVVEFPAVVAYDSHGGCVYKDQEDN